MTGLFDKLIGKKEPEQKIVQQEKVENETEETDSDSANLYPEACALCGQPGTEKKWMGQFWHKKCMRTAKKQSKKMI